MFKSSAKLVFVFIESKFYLIFYLRVSDRYISKSNLNFMVPRLCATFSFLVLTV